MRFEEYVSATIKTLKQNIIYECMDARCFRKVPVHKNHAIYTNNMFVKRMAERLNYLVTDDESAPAKITPSLLHVCLYFTKMYFGMDFRTRMLRHFAQVFYDALWNSVKKMCKMKAVRDEDIKMLSVSSVRLEELYEEWYESQNKISQATCDAIVLCTKSRKHLLDVSTICLGKGYTVNSDYFQLVAGKMLETIGELYKLVVFEEHKMSAMEAELKVHQSAMMHVLNGVKNPEESQDTGKALDIRDVMDLGDVVETRDVLETREVPKTQEVSLEAPGIRESFIMRGCPATGSKCDACLACERCFHMLETSHADEELALAVGILAALRRMYNSP